MKLHEIANHPGVVVRPALVTLALLLTPLVGTLFGGWSWDWQGFAIFGSIFFGAGLAYELFGKTTPAGTIGGFIFGLAAAGILVTVLHRQNPEEDHAGFVVVASVFSSICFAIVGHLLQRFILRNRSGR